MTKRILVVEDQPDNRQIIRAYCGTCWSQSVMATEIALIGVRLDGAEGATPGSSA